MLGIDNPLERAFCTFNVAPVLYLLINLAEVFNMGVNRVVVEGALRAVFLVIVCQRLPRKRISVTF